MEESFKVPRRPQLSLGPIAAAAESYRLTDSGAIWIKGGDHGATARIQPSGLSPQSSDSRGLDDAATAGEDEEGDDLFSIIDRAVLLEPLGRGASGQVHKALDLSALRYVAIKSINVQDRSRRRQLATELQTLHSGLASRTAAVGPGQRGDARHVVRFFDAFAHAPTASVWLMVEYADGGSLEELVTAGGVRDHALLATLFRHAARGLRFLHATRHVHRDIKPANCLLTRRGGLKISDFGVACRLAEPEQPRAGAMMDSRLEDVDSDRAVAERHECSRPVLTKTQSFVGTSTYMSPERIGGDLYSTAADIWSLGCTFIASGPHKPASFEPHSRIRPRSTEISRTSLSLSKDGAQQRTTTTTGTNGKMRARTRAHTRAHTCANHAYYIALERARIFGRKKSPNAGRRDRDPSLPSPTHS